MPMKQDHTDTINKLVSQMAHAKNLGEPLMAHLENLYNTLTLFLLS